MSETVTNKRNGYESAKVFRMSEVILLIYMALLTIREKSALTEAGNSALTLSVFYSLAGNVCLSVCLSSTLICILIALKLAQIFGASTVSGER